MQELLRMPAVLLGALDGFETTVVAFTTDIPAFGERVGEAVFCSGRDRFMSRTPPKSASRRTQIVEAIQIYKRMIAQLMNS